MLGASLVYVPKQKRLRADIASKGSKSFRRISSSADISDVSLIESPRNVSYLDLLEKGSRGSMSMVLELGPGETFLFDTPGGTTTYVNLLARPVLYS